jgi:hypothetical protein
MNGIPFIITTKIPQNKYNQVKDLYNGISKILIKESKEVRKRKSSIFMEY